MRSVEAEEGRGAGVVVGAGTADVKKKNCLMISASSSCYSCFLVDIVLSAAAARAVFIVSIVIVRGAALTAVLVRSRRGRRRAAPSGRVPSPRLASPRRRDDFGFHLLDIFVAIIFIVVVIVIVVVIIIVIVIVIVIYIVIVIVVVIVLLY